MDVEKIIREYLANLYHMSLATSVSDKPWVCEVHFGYDDNLNLYFRSKPIRRHSQEIAKNSNVAGNMVEQHAVDQKPRGVYFEGRAEMLRDVTEGSLAYKTLSDRLNLDSGVIEESKEDDGHKFYKITVNDWYLFDSRESSPSQKYHLKR